MGSMSSVRRRVAMIDWCASRKAVSIMPTRGFALAAGASVFLFSVTVISSAFAAGSEAGAAEAAPVVILVAITLPLQSLISFLISISDIDNLTLPSSYQPYACRSATCL